jgi:hypothetical protein
MPSRCLKCGALRKPNESCSCSDKTTKSKKKSRWDATRPNVKPLFERAGFIHCELRLDGCNESIGTGFAHTKTQRHLTDKELYIIAFLCNNCHRKIEGKPWMEQTILDIRKRNTIPEIDEIINEYYRTDGTEKRT